MFFCITGDAAQPWYVYIQQLGATVFDSTARPSLSDSPRLDTMASLQGLDSIVSQWNSLLVTIAFYLC